MQQQHKTSSKFTSLRNRSVEAPLQAFDWFSHMRAKNPVAFNVRMGDWHVFRYDDVYRVITETSIFSSEGVPNVADNFLRDTIIALDPPNHHKLRNLICTLFTPRATNRLKETIIQKTQARLDALLPQGEIDLVADIAFPVTADVLATLIGVPDEDLPRFYSWANGSDTPSPQNPEEELQLRNIVGQEIYDYCSQLLAESRHTPREGLFTTLSNTEINGESLSDDELVKFCLLLIAAGQKTVQNLIANAMYCFMTYPESRKQLILQPELMPSAIDEVLRFLPPFWITVRRTTADTELGGQRIPSDSIIQAWNASAGRDSVHFPDADRFDIQRKPNQHLGFGHGIHFCVGAPLGRLEAQIVLSMILDQLKNLQRIPEIPFGITPGPIHTIYSIPLMFDV